MLCNTSLEVNVYDPMTQLSHFLRTLLFAIRTCMRLEKTVCPFGFVQQL